jgi:hypothetical protein
VFVCKVVLEIMSVIECHRTVLAAEESFLLENRLYVSFQITLESEVFVVDRTFERLLVFITSARIRMPNEFNSLSHTWFKQILFFL